MDKTLVERLEAHAHAHADREAGMGAERLLTRGEVERRTGFKRSAIYARIAEGTFPAPRREPDTGTVRWLESDVQAWIAAWVERSVEGGKMMGSKAAKTKKAA